jgi:hypothetical protein
MRAGVAGRFNSPKSGIGLQLRERAQMNLVQRLVRANRTIDGIQSDGIHFFFAGKRRNQAKPLLPRFSAVFAVARVRTWSMSQLPLVIARAIELPGQPNSMRRAASRERGVEAATAPNFQ